MSKSSDIIQSNITKNESSSSSASSSDEENDTPEQVAARKPKTPSTSKSHMTKVCHIFRMCFLF